MKNRLSFALLAASALALAGCSSPYFICALVLALAAFIASRHFTSVTTADPNKGNGDKEP